ncbi:MAG: hypothetical protein ACD_79C00485G0001 [uncultured bacterium]|nr:MAG: hypothetical protein ACD_79C00485G0001 [uncultured bacterium]
MKVLLNQAVKHKNIMMPGYTHLQQAQVVIAAQHFLAYINMFDRDKSRLNDCLKRMDFCPLGVGAIAGTGLGNDRMMVAKELGFKNVTDNSLDTVADRDFALELLFCISLIALHLSRFSEEIIIWYTSEFDFIELDETWCTGSSLMPQKSNPDIAELIRGKTGKFLGNLVNLYTTVKGLPLTYNRDLQEDKEGVFSSICNIKNCLSVFTDMIASLKIKNDILKRQKDDYMLATDMAEYLVKKALPFRKAHHVVGSIVRYAGENNLKLADLSLEKFKEFSPLFDKTIFNFLKLEKSADFKNTFGSTSSREVIRQINRWKKILNSNKKGN